MGFTLQRLHIEAVGGVAGDMLLGALLDLGADAAPIHRAFASLAIPELRLHVTKVEVHGEAATYVRSIAPGSGHAHHHLSDIFALLDRAEVTSAARDTAKNIFTILGDAEATVHGGTPHSVHLHEVGELDSVMDVLGIAVALDTLGHPEVRCTPLPSGEGTVDTSHGVLTCPVPAVVEVAREHKVPLESVDLPGETVTPTGIAVVAALAQAYEPVPPGAPHRGCGAGTKRFVTRPNVVRVHGW